MSKEEKIEKDLNITNNCQNEVDNVKNDGTETETIQNIIKEENTYNETIQTIETNKFNLKEIIDYKDGIEFFGTICLVIIVIAIFIRYKKVINKKSKNNYENNLRNKKFIEDIYVEMGETNENVRYFIYGNRWKKRINQSLNNIMSENNKKISKKIYKINGLTLNKKLCSYEELLKKIKTNKGRGAKYQNELWFLDHNSYYYRDEIEYLRKKYQIINSRILFILGKAGSGKTNLATYIAKVINEKNNFFCIYINAKDVKDGNIEQNFKEFFCTDIIINGSKEKLIYLYLMILKFFRKKIYIIVEALNENTDSNFVYNLSMFINKYNKYDNFRFIITSRIEFFDVKYKKVIDEHLIDNYEMIEMDNTGINEIMKKRMIEKYRQYYNYTGMYNERVTEIIEESPILMRIFFETYKDTNKDVNDINKYSLLLNYIKNVQERTANINVMEILNKIVNKMLEFKKFDSIGINDIEVNNKELEQLINENVLLNKSIIKSENSLEEETEEIIMFTFDELRDFLISRVIANNKNGQEVLNFIAETIENKEPIAEGVLRNIYLNYKIKQEETMCKRLLEFDISSVIRDSFLYRHRKEDWFENFVLDMIFENNIPVFKCEIEYINNIAISRRDTWKIIRDLWKNTLSKSEPNFTIVDEEIKKLKKNINNKSFLKNLMKEDYKDIYEMLIESNSKSTSELAAKINNIIGVLYEETIS